MFTPITPVSDTELSKDELANMALTQAMLQLSKLTQLSNEECLSMIKKQLFVEAAPYKAPKATANLLDNQESDYIISLFN